VSERFLVVRAGGERYGLALEHVREVVDVAQPRPVPARVPAVRGVMQLRGRHLSLVHLVAFLRGSAPPAAQGDTAVVVSVKDTLLALEVDEVEDVVDRAAVWVGEAPAAWASGVWRVGEGLVTVLDLALLVDRLEGVEAREAAGTRSGGAG
jgi:purine-binding chemotaxis protein CheW